MICNIAGTRQVPIARGMQPGNFVKVAMAGKVGSDNLFLTLSAKAVKDKVEPG